MKIAWDWIFIGLVIVGILLYVVRYHFDLLVAIFVNLLE